MASSGTNGDHDRNLGNSNNEFVKYVFIDLDAKKQPQKKKPKDQTVQLHQTSLTVNESVQCIDRTCQKVFLFNVDSDRRTYKRGMPTDCVFLPKTAAYLEEAKHRKTWCWLEMEILAQALSERLLMEEPSKHVTFPNQRDPRTGEPQPASQLQTLRYMFESYQRCKELQERPRDADVECLQKCEEVIIYSTGSILTNPDFYPGNIHRQALDIVRDNTAPFAIPEFLQKVAESITDDTSVSRAFTPILSELKSYISTASLADPKNYTLFDTLQIFSRIPELAKVLLCFEQPLERSAKLYEETLFGYGLSLSCVSASGTEYDFFDKALTKSSQDRQLIKNYIWKLSSEFNNRLHQIFKAILKSSTENRNTLLHWISSCLDANKERCKSKEGNACSRDGFFINLTAVMMLLCEPFCKPGSAGILKVDMAYCDEHVTAETSGDTMASVGVHTIGLKEASKLTQRTATQDGKGSQSFKFVTDIYFLTQWCLQSCLNPVFESAYKLNRELAENKEFLTNAAVEGASNNPLATDVSRLIALQTALLEPQLVRNSLHFHTSSVRLLNHLVASSNTTTELVTPQVPLPENVPDILSRTPECIAENVTDFFSLLQRFDKENLEEATEFLYHFVIFIVVFMGNKRFMNNQHLRANLADKLEDLLPINYDSTKNQKTMFFLERLFKEHPFDDHIPQAVLSIFVDIEFSDDPNEFEKRFKHRKPIYSVIRYLWSLEKHRKTFKSLAETAVQAIDAHTTPLFLQFINLLINDATFTLDEAVSHLKTIGQHDRGEFDHLPLMDQLRNAQQVKSSTMRAKFYNIMSKESLACLALLTTEIKDIFTHPLMVDRLAVMLNDFLLKLVGKSRNELKVKDFQEVHFDPGRMVRHICQIYINLGDNEGFCKEVSHDRRSYSHELFPSAERILGKIRAPAKLTADLRKFADNVKMFAEEQMTVEEDDFPDAPEEFLDPITFTLMEDPVTLPSGTNIDRAVITRHVLSDHTDPFNRSPLTMTQVTTNADLKRRIDAWKEQHKRESS